MKLYPQSACQLAFLSLCCLLITVRESDSTFVPGRCLCPETQPGVRGQLKELTVYPKSASCNKVTVIVTLKSNNNVVCLNPEAPLGKQMTRCWNRAQTLGRDVKLCLRRRKKGRGQRQRQHQRQRQRSRQRTRGHNKKTSSSNSQ
ncbi:C-X-C motif chemokine 10-like [Plectropomus leopardus]|uniref:C-X-C motif chemokine 10-like n=1 Tax=Plectropomus leopardus TaxID=160734 RepID=UPI001C4D57DA|nr:C-X-C motif chemokine 10-like [Plectropomus leopardus]